MSRRSLSSRLSIRASWPFARTPVFDTPKTIIIPRLPPEVIEAIIDHISDKHSLKSCSLVSTAFLGPSQKRLFTNITLRRRTEEDNPFSGFHDLITQKSHILANLITSLNLIDFEVGHTTWFLLDTGFIPRILASVPNLTHIGIQSERRELSPQIRDALNGVYAACPLTSVSLRGLRVDLPDILRRCLFLREVGLADIELIADTQPSPCAKEWVADTTDLDAFCASPKLHPTSSEPVTAFTLQAHISQFVFQLTRTMGPSIIDDILHSSIWVSLSRSLRVLELDLIHFRHTDALQRLLDATSPTVHELRICTFDVGSLAFQIPPSTTNVVFHFKFAPGFCKTNPSFVDIFQPFNKLHRHRHASEGLSDVRIQLEVSAHSLFDRPAWEWAFLDEILICVRKVVWVVITLVTPGRIMDEMRYAFADRVSECLPRARQKQVLRVMVV